jgi:magnesium-transporting ATPase (P-type)
MKINMSEKDKEPLSSFMKKQINEKSSKKNLEKKAAAAKKEKSDAKDKDKETDAEEEKVDPTEEMTDEEKLEDAKKASRNKAAEYDQTDMIKKMILENVVKYTLLIAATVLLAIGLIKFGAAILAFLNGLMYRVIMGALHQ